MRFVRPVAVGMVLVLVAATAHARGGGPIAGLNEAELLEWKRGFDLFRNKLFVQEGLGPGFNNQGRCYACHRNPALGGQSPKMITRFGRIENGVYDPLVELGGPVLQERGNLAHCTEHVPATANVVVERNSTFLFGSGLIDAIPDQQILDRAAAELALDPARAGRVNMVTSVSTGLQHVGRFGWKASQGLLIDAVGEAMLLEMGFTNPLFPTETAPNGDAGLLGQCDAVPDPEDTGDFLDTVTFLLRFLADPPPPPKVTPVMQLGESLFNQIGCEFCHYSGYTAVSSHPALNGKPVELYSDLLLHDIGTGDGIVQGNAQGNEFRTPPLWVVRGVHPYLHDGRARNPIQAIDAHKNEALDSRNAFFALSTFEQNAILRFLRR